MLVRPSGDAVENIHKLLTAASINDVPMFCGRFIIQRATVFSGGLLRAS